MVPPFFFRASQTLLPPMSDNTQGLRMKSGSQALRAGVELLSSMRFAISLLTVI